ncbi:MAG: hypothetical protein AB1489_31010 [Acidobacteriota bacterium]
MGCKQWDLSIFVKYYQSELPALQQQKLFEHSQYCDECRYCYEIFSELTLMSELSQQDQQEIAAFLKSQLWQELKERLAREYSENLLCSTIDKESY